MLKSKLQEKDIKSRKRKQLLQKIDEIAKKKSLPLTSVDKDIKRSDRLSVQAETERIQFCTCQIL